MVLEELKEERFSLLAHHSFASMEKNCPYSNIHRSMDSILDSMQEWHKYGLGSHRMKGSPFLPTCLAPID